MQKASELRGKLEKDMPFVDISGPFGRCDEVAYLRKLEREIREREERAKGRVLTLAEDTEFGCPGGVIEEWGGRLHFPGREANAFVDGRVVNYQRGYTYVVARVGLRNQDPERPNIVIEGCLLFPDGSAILPLGDGRAQVIDVLATYEE